MCCGFLLKRISRTHSTVDEVERFSECLRSNGHSVGADAFSALRSRFKNFQVLHCRCSE